MLKRTSPVPWQPIAAVVLLHVLGILAPWENGTPLAPAQSAAAIQVDVRTMLATLDSEWQAVFKSQVIAPYETALAKLKAQYRASIETGITKANSAKDEKGAAALVSERKRFSETNTVPVEDLANPPPMNAIPLPLKEIRAAWRKRNAEIEKERDSRAQALHAGYDQVLAQAQTDFAELQRPNDALLVKARRNAVASAWLTPAGITAGGTLAPLVATSAAPSPKGAPGAKQIDSVELFEGIAPPPKRAPGAKLETELAKVEAQDVTMAPLAKDERLWSDRQERLVEIPPQFEGFRFTQTRAHGLTLHFKVLTDGFVYICCMSRWGTTASPDVAKDFTTEQKLKDAGWSRVTGAEILGRGDDVIWLIFSRPCKAGEEFTYRTDKYAPPILLVK